MSEKHVIRLASVFHFFKDEEKLVSRDENAVESGHVENMIFDPDRKILKGVVHASMRDKQYKVEINLGTDWTIISAHCSCPRGQFRCHHMAALSLFGHYNVSITDKACTWSNKKDARSASDTKSMVELYPPRVHRSTERDLSNQEIEDFKKKLKVLDAAVGFTWLLSGEVVENIDFVPNIEEIIFSENYQKSSSKLEYFTERMMISYENILKTSEQTIGQAQNEKWLICRKHRLTASHFGIVLGACRRNHFPKSLFKQLTGTYNLDHIKSIQWGREHEAEGIAALELALNVEVNLVGLWLHPCGFLGASPDGLIGEDAIVEVKCPFKYRAISMLERIKTSKEYIISADADGSITINRSHDYFFQIQGLLAITKRKLCHLVVWTPQDVVTVEIEAEDFEKHIGILKNFYLTRYIKFLLGDEY